jgi:predicted ATPase
MELKMKMIRQRQIYIITGGPGFGKTELINDLRKLGYLCSGEFARDLIQSQQQSGGEILPWKNPKLFQQEVLKQRIAFFESVPEDTFAFADRGIPDQLAFARYKGFGTPEILIESAQNYRYALQVFVAPPWREIFENDSIRTESFEEAVKIHQAVLDTYSDLNYKVIELPLLPLNKRVKFLLQAIPKI